MSHFTTVKTKFTDQNTLVESLKELGYNQVQVGQFQCRGYQGNQTTVDILIQLQGGYDIGFVNRDTSFEMIADWYGIQGITKNELSQKLNQKYSISMLEKFFLNKRKSFNVSGCSSIVLTLVAICL